MISQFLLFCNRECYLLKLFVILDIYVLYDSEIVIAIVVMGKVDYTILDVFIILQYIISICV